MKPVIKEYLAALLTAYIFAVVLSWPLVWNGDQLLTSSIAEGDIGFTIFAQWWVSEALSGGDSLNWSHFVQYPEGSEILRQLWNIPVILITAPLHFAFSPLMAYNQSIFLIVSLNGLAAYILGRRWGTSQAVLALVVMTSLPYAWNELGKGRLEQGFLAPMILWILSLYHLRDGGKYWVCGLAMAGVANCYWFYAPMAAFLSLFILRSRFRCHFRSLVKAALLSIVLSLPQMVYVLPILKQFQRQATFENLEGVRIQMENAWWPLDSIPFLGGAIEGKLPLIAFALLLFSKRKLIFPIAIFAIIMALGPILSHHNTPITVFGHSLLLPHYLLDYIPVFMRFYWPYRWLSLLCCAVVLAAVHSTFSRKNTILVALFFLIEGYILLPVGFNPTMNTEQSDPYSFSQEGRFLRVTTSPFWETMNENNKAILSFPTQNQADRHVFWIPFHQHPIATFPNYAGHSKVLDKLAQQDQGGLYRSWLNDRSICQSNTKESLEFLQQQQFQWIIWHKPNLRNPLPAEEKKCLERKLGAPTYEDSQIIAWNIMSNE